LEHSIPIPESAAQTVCLFAYLALFTLLRVIAPPLALQMASTDKAVTRGEILYRIIRKFTLINGNPGSLLIVALIDPLNLDV